MVSAQLYHSLLVICVLQFVQNFALQWSMHLPVTLGFPGTAFSRESCYPYSCCAWNIHFNLEVMSVCLPICFISQTTWWILVNICYNQTNSVSSRIRPPQTIIYTQVFLPLFSSFPCLFSFFSCFLLFFSSLSSSLIPNQYRSYFYLN